MESENKEKGPGRLQIWLKRVGVAGFLFFFVKGLIWIAIFVGIGKCAL